MESVRDKAHSIRMKPSSPPRFALTHCNAHTEQATDDLIDNSIQVLVAGLSTIDLVVCIVPKAQAEEIRFSNNKVEVLIKDLRDMLRCAGRGYL